MGELGKTDVGVAGRWSGKIDIVVGARVIRAAGQRRIEWKVGAKVVK